MKYNYVHRQLIDIHILSSGVKGLKKVETNKILGKKIYEEGGSGKRAIALDS